QPPDDIVKCAMAGPRSPAPVSLDLFQEEGALDLLNRVRDLNPARAGVGAVEDGPAPPDARLLVQDAQPFTGALVAAVKDEAVGVHDRGGPHEVLVCPRDRAGGGAGGAQNALGRVVEPETVLGALQPLAGTGRVVRDQVR